MKKSKYAFTMIELIFVIVIMGVLAAVAIPKFGNTKEQADLVKARSEISSVRSGIITERQARLIKGDSSWITNANLDSGGLFGGALMYPLANKDKEGSWYTATTGNGSYIYKLGGVSITFDYNSTSGKFSCDTLNGTYGTKCKSLIE